MPPRTTIAIDFVRRRLRGVEATSRRGSITIDRALSVAMPDEIDSADDRGVGEWIGRTLKANGLEATHAVIAVNREHAVVRSLELPTCDLDEVPDMVNLSMRRDLPIDADEAVIDFIVTGSTEGRTEVLACAIPRRIVERVRDVTAAAGVVPTRISLRCFGTASLVNSLEDSDGESVLGIDLGEDGFELVVSRDGRIGFTRGVEIRPSPDGIDETIVTEVRRSWISHRLSADDEEEVARGVLFAPFMLASRLEGWVGEATGLAVSTVRTHPKVRVPGDFPGDAWPLAGLLLRHVLNEPTIDFGAPRRAPDLAARRRIRILAVIGGCLLAFLLGWTFGNLGIDRERATNADLEAKARVALKEYHRNRRDRLRLEHLEKWTGVEPDWLSQLDDLQEFASDNTRIVLDGFAGTLLVQTVRYDERAKDFTVEAEARMDLSGETLDRSTADQLRSEIVDDERYLLRSIGAETAGGKRLSVPFGFQLRTAVKPRGTGAPPDGGDG